MQVRLRLSFSGEGLSGHGKARPLRGPSKALSRGSWLGGAGERGCCPKALTRLASSFLFTQ